MGLKQSKNRIGDGYLKLGAVQDKPYGDGSNKLGFEEQQETMLKNQQATMFDQQKYRKEKRTKN